MRRRGKKDGNHDEVCKAFREVGCMVIETHNTGIPGWPDIVVGCIGLNHLVEIKSTESAYGRKGLNDNQQAFARDWNGGKVWVVTSAMEAYALVRNWRRA